MYPINFFYRAVRCLPDALAVVDQDDALTYRELKSEVMSFASALQALDPKPLSRVGICAYNSKDHLIAWLAVLAAGKTWVPLYPKNTQSEIGRLIEVTKASIVITIKECLDLVGAGKAHVVVLDEESAESNSAASLRSAHAGHVPTFHSVALHEPQAIKFTGGTTGPPKGVLQPLRAWNANIISQIYAWNLNESDRFLASAPITHGTSTYLLPTLAAGGCVVIVDRPRVEETLTLMAEQNISTLFVPPTVIYMMLELPNVGDRAFPRLRNLIYGAGPMRPDAIAEAQKLFGPVIASTYGQTEAPQIATYIRGVDLQRPEKRGSVGRESPLTQVAVMEDNRLLPPGETGEVVFRGDLLMTGYLNQPEKTAETVIDGWLHTGDLGLIDDEGFLFIKGRAKDIIISGGFNVYPGDVESTLARHSAVHDCAVFGVPDKKWGEAVRAAVSLRAAKTTTEAELIAFLREELGPVKTPKSIAFYNELPRNAYGKLQKQELIDDALQSLQEPAR